MPAADAILAGLRTVANEWSGLAIAWHAYFAALAVALLAGWRPEQRDLGLYLVLPFVSVATLGWLTGDPFNATALAAVGLVLLLVSCFLGRAPVAPGPAWAVAAGAALFLLGWAYPQFLDTDSHWPYLYRGPLGLLPAPTLAAVTGLSAAFGGFESRTWSVLLALATAAYGLFGALYLGVSLDWALPAGAAVLALSERARRQARQAAFELA